MGAHEAGYPMNRRAFLGALVGLGLGLVADADARARRVSGGRSGDREAVRSPGRTRRGRLWITWRTRLAEAGRQVRKLEGLTRGTSTHGHACSPCTVAAVASLMHD